MKKTTDALLWGVTLILAGAAVALLVGSVTGRDGGAVGAVQTWRRHRAMKKVVVEEWARLIDVDSRIGPRDADEVIVEFGDYACTYCRRARDSAQSLVLAGRGEVAVVYRHSPPAQGAAGDMAARASICAEGFGLFERMHDKLFEDDQWMRFPSIEEWQEFLDGIEPRAPTEWSTCMLSGETDARLALDKELAELLDIQLRPTFVGLGGVGEGLRPVSAIRRLGN